MENKYDYKQVRIHKLLYGIDTTVSMDTGLWEEVVLRLGKKTAQKFVNEIAVEAKTSPEADKLSLSRYVQRRLIRWLGASTRQQWALTQ